MHVVLVPNNKTNERSNSLILKQHLCKCHRGQADDVRWDYYYVKVGL